MDILSSRTEPCADTGGVSSSLMIGMVLGMANAGRCHETIHQPNTEQQCPDQREPFRLKEHLVLINAPCSSL